MQGLLSVAQLDFALDGLSLGELSRSIAHDYFVEGLKKADIARHYDRSPGYIGEVIGRVEKNLEKNLKARKMKIQVIITPDVTPDD